MKGSFSRRTINASMPVIQAIFSNLEIETKKYKDLDKRDTFHLFALEKIWYCFYKQSHDDHS